VILRDVPPLTPDDETARRWLAVELGKPEYQAARPTWFDLLSQKVADWFDSLHVSGSGSGGTMWLAVAGAVFVAALIAGALIRYGAPRRNRRLSAAASGAIADVRTAAQLRAAADRAAATGDWSLAALERFRALAAGLDERTVLVIRPGTTAHEVGVLAGAAFPVEAAALREAADGFDAVRYLGRRAEAADHERLRALDERLGQTSPVFEAAR
jgi:hypothetical protein